MIDINRKSRKNLYSIQAFRGIAAMLVVLLHFTDRSKDFLGQVFCFNIFSFGGSGVDFFFVLSGFIIFYVHRQDLSKRERFKDFIIKRFIRIYPIYFFLTLIILPVYLLGYGKAYKTDVFVILKSFLLFPQDRGIFPVVNVGWTLSYEALFYILFSLAILLRPNIIRAALTTWILGIVTVTTINCTSNYLIDSTLINFLFNTRNIEFLLGCLVAHLIHLNNVKNSYRITLVGCFLFICFGFFYNHFNLFLLDKSYEILISVIGFGISSALIILGSAVSDINSITSNAPRILRELGDASYSIYLTHFSIFSALILVSNKLKIFDILGYHLSITSILMLTILLGIATYRFIEKPMLIFLRSYFFSKTTKNNS
jgi:exopolysaccharide production protein ExoZ